MHRPATAALLLLALTPAAAGAAIPRTPPYVTVIHASCPDAPTSDPASCADPADATIYLMRGSDQFARQHELGHLYDAELLDDTERAAITPLLGAPAGTPWTRDDCVQHLCPNEMVADAYAACRLGLEPQPFRRHGRRISTGWQTSYGYSPATNRRHARTCAAISRAAAG
jgi:hypothetical protein